MFCIPGLWGWAGLAQRDISIFFSFFLNFKFFIFLGRGGRWKINLLYSMAEGVRSTSPVFCGCFVLFCLHCHERLVFHGWLGIEACQPRRIALCRQDLLRRIVHLHYRPTVRDSRWGSGSH